MFQVFVSGYRLANTTQGKPFYIYSVEMINTSSGMRHFTEKRYSEFNNLHRLLKKECHVAPFPPKRVRNSNPKILEQRRAALEIYMQKMLRLSSTKQQVLNFLGIDDEKNANHYTSRSSINFQNSSTPSQSLQHHPIYCFHRDPFVQSHSNSSLPDIVTHGVLLGIYKS